MCVLDEEGSWMFASSGMDSQLQQLKRFDTVFTVSLSASGSVWYGLKTGGSRPGTYELQFFLNFSFKSRAVVTGYWTSIATPISNWSSYLCAGVIPHIHKSLIGKKGSQKAA